MQKQSSHWMLLLVHCLKRWRHDINSQFPEDNVFIWIKENMLILGWSVGKPWLEPWIEIESLRASVCPDISLEGRLREFMWEPGTWRTHSQWILLCKLWVLPNVICSYFKNNFLRNNKFLYMIFKILRVWNGRNVLCAKKLLFQINILFTYIKNR